MSDTNTLPNSTAAAQTADALAQWGPHAPRGGRAVLNRMLKGDTKVPLFLGQTLVKSLRDQGYNTTTSALCEFVDNSFQWGATEVRVYIRQDKRDKTVFRILVLDNGVGMTPNGQQVSMSFGGSMAYEARDGISRYGMGMKTAGLSISKVVENYTWQEPRAYYNITLDVEDIGATKSNLLEVPAPQLNDDLPSDMIDLLTRPAAWPKPDADTAPLAADREELHERLGNSGTIVFLPSCDRLTHKTERTLVENAIKEMGRVYRRFLVQGKKLFVNNRPVVPFDPTYQMAGAWHTRVEGLTQTRSRLIFSKVVQIPISDHPSAEKTPVRVRLFALPYEDWIGLGRTVLKNKLHVYGDYTVSFVRNDREVDIAATVRALGLNKHHTNNWLRLEIDFGGEADEGFGIASNKQGVRLRAFAADPIKEAIHEELVALRNELKELKAKDAAVKSGGAFNAAEQAATEAEALQGKPLPPEAETPEQKADLEKNLRGLATALKRNGETDEQAFQRVSENRFLVHTKSDPYWPFFHTEYKYERVILTINTAHPFFQKVWEPLEQLCRAGQGGDGEHDEDAEANPDVAQACSGALVGLQMLFLSLARAQAQMMGTAKSRDDADHRQLFENLRREWSSNLATQLRVGLTSAS